MGTRIVNILLILILLFQVAVVVAQPDLSPLDDPAIQRVEPFQVFDNLYYVGANWVSAWVLETDEGLILIDSLYDGLVDIAINGIRELGMDPKDIKYVLVTHGHFDHVGGAKRMQDEYGATVAMVKEDWNIVAGEPIYQPYPKPVKQVVIDDGDTLTLGNTTITFYKTPGHTTGVMSMKFQVLDKGVPHTAFMFGGVGLNFSGVERTENYIESVKRLMQFNDIEVNIPNHEGAGDVFERYQKLKKRQAGESHAFVDPEGFRKWLNELLVNAQAKLAQEQADNR